jgi:hypothetical protein
MGGNLIRHQKTMPESNEEDITEQFLDTCPIYNPEVFGDSGLEKVTIG